LHPQAIPGLRNAREHELARDRRPEGDSATLLVEEAPDSIVRDGAATVRERTLPRLGVGEARRQSGRKEQHGGCQTASDR
jgi:hypothetical protein